MRFFTILRLSPYSTRTSTSVHASQKIGAILSRPEYKFESQRKTDGMQYKVKKRE